MERSFREKIALVVLALLIVLISVCSCAYMSTGKQWTVAATFVDDTVGSMDGYTVIVYPGTVVPEEEEEFVPVNENGLFGVSEDPVDSELAADASEESGEAEQSEGEEGSENENRFLPLIQGIEDPIDSRLYVSEVRAEYLIKEAGVLTLDTNNLSRYSEPGLYIVNGKRIAVFSAEDTLTDVRLNVFKQLIAQMNAEIVMCVTPSLSNLPTLDGIDIALLTAAEDGYTTIGSSINNTYILRTPEVSSVGVIIITPNNVASSKVVDAIQPDS